MKKIILLKLGGSLITDKTKPFTVRLKVIRNLARQIAGALKDDKNIQLIIGNGAGSFAHYPATNYKMIGKLKNENQKMGFSVVQDAASRLNRIIVSELLKVGVRAISLNPSSMIIARGGKFRTFLTRHCLGILNLEMTPILYGDIVYDEVFGFKIFSTEQLLSELARRFIKKNIKIAKIIHNGITKGVLDEKGALISKITKEKYLKLKHIFFKTKGFDVTGGMIHKVEESLALAELGIQTLIINGTTSRNLLKKALCGQEVEGTLITR